MNDYVEIVVGDHGTIYVEVAPTVKEGWRETGLAEMREKLVIEFNQAMETVRTTALGFLDGLKAMEKKARPDEATLEFGLTFGGEAGIAIKATGDAAFKVSLTWKNSEDED